MIKKRNSLSTWVGINLEYIEWGLKLVLFIVVVILCVILYFVPRGLMKGYSAGAWVLHSFLALVATVLALIGVISIVWMVRYRLCDPTRRKTFWIKLTVQIVDFAAIFLIGYLAPFWLKAIIGVVAIVVVLLIAMASDPVYDVYDPGFYYGNREMDV